MAEIALKIGNNNSYYDGDIVDVFNDNRILITHAQHICHVKLAGLTKDGLRPQFGLARMLQEHIYEYLFQRISYDTIVAFNLKTGTETIYNNYKHPVDGRRINVPEFIARRIMHPQHRIFGIRGREFWFGGELDFSPETTNKIWNEIEKYTAYNRKNFMKWSWGTEDRKKFLFLPIYDISNEKAIQLKSSNDDYRRVFFVKYWILDDMPLNDVRDKTKTVDIRDRQPYNIDEIIHQKTEMSILVNQPEYKFDFESDYPVLESTEAIDA